MLHNEHRLRAKAGVKNKLHPSILKGTQMQSFINQSNSINKLLLGQQLLQNNNLFSQEMVSKCQGEGPQLSEIMLNLRSEKPEVNKNS